MVAMTDRQEKIERIAKAAVCWVYDMGCANALMELQNSVVDLIGIEIEEVDAVPTYPENEG